ncbi:MAG: hypothetical protein ACOYMN_09280 [Roseimicrobium sp.]
MKLPGLATDALPLWECGSLLPLWNVSELARGTDTDQRGKSPSTPEPPTRPAHPGMSVHPRQQAACTQSGSKLRALQIVVFPAR